MCHAADRYEELEAPILVRDWHRFATFTGLTGARMSLVRRPGTGDASLDDVVLGYLAAANAAGTAR